LDVSALPTTDALARRFAAVLLEWLGATTLRDVNARNATYAAEYGDPNRVCATHDFCDANQAMLDALESLHGPDYELSDDAVHALINAAWTQAKAAGFWVQS
jgi:hypothetical protein